MAKFNLLAYLLPPEDKKFYNLFEDSTNTCKDAAELFNTIVNVGINHQHIITAKTVKHKSNDILKETIKELNITFVTPIDREDIQSISTLLNKITKKIIKACVNLRVYRLANYTDNLKKQAETLLQATDELSKIIHKFKKVSSIKDITESNFKMKEIETHGDEILYRAMDELFSGKYEALEVMKLRDIHKDLESALDTCFSVTDQIVNIVLKQS